MSNQLAKTNQDKLKTMMRSEDVRNRFSEILGPQARGYIASVMIAVASNDRLQECSPVSVVTSAMRAATLKLSCDPALGQAYLVPFRKSKKVGNDWTNWYEAQFIPGYRGIRDIALRTGKYVDLNVGHLYEGQIITENQITGRLALSGSKRSDKVIGYIAYMRLTNGFEKAEYWTVERIHEHAKQYSKSYGKPDSPWTTDTAKMEKKTVLKNFLMAWGPMDPNDLAALRENDNDENDVVDSSFIQDDEDDDSAPKSESEMMAGLGFDPEPEQPTPAQEAPTQPDLPTEKPWTDPKVSMATAKAERSSDGDLYWDMPTDQLALRANSLTAVIKKNGLTPEDKEQKQLKLDIIRAIMAYRTK